MRRLTIADTIKGFGLILGVTCLSMLLRWYFVDMQLSSPHLVTLGLIASPFFYLVGKEKSKEYTKST